MNAALGTFVPLTVARRGVQRLASTGAVAHDTTFLVGLSRAFYWKSLLDSGSIKSGCEIAVNEGLHHSVVNELLRLTLLAPDIIGQLMAGTGGSRGQDARPAMRPVRAAPQSDHRLEEATFRACR